MGGELTKNGAAQVKSLLESRKAEFGKALQNGIDPDHFVRVALTTIQQNTKLLECTQASLYNALLKAAQLSLNCDGLLGQAYLVPYAAKAELIIGYKGLRELALRTGKYKDIRARVVYEKDHFKVSLGSNEFIEHVPAENDRGGMRAVYAVAVTEDDTALFEFMWGKEVEKHRNQYSKSWKKPDSMWQTTPERAWEKTVVRRLCNRLQMSVVAVGLMAREDRMDLGLELPDDDFIDVTDDSGPIEDDSAETKAKPPGKKKKGVGGLVDAVDAKQEKVPEVDPGLEDFREVVVEKLNDLLPSKDKEIRAFTEREFNLTLGGDVNGIHPAVVFAYNLDIEELTALWEFIKDK